MSMRTTPLSLRLELRIQSKLKQASTALSEALEIVRAHEGRVRRAKRGHSRQDSLRNALRTLGQVPKSAALPDPDLGIFSLAGVEEEIQVLASETKVGLQGMLTHADGVLGHTKDRIARLEAVYVTLERAQKILQAPDKPGTTPVERLQFDLGEKLVSLYYKVERMLNLLERTQETESLRFAPLRPQVEKALAFLQKAGVLSGKGTSQGQGKQQVSRGRSAEAIK